MFKFDPWRYVTYFIVLMIIFSCAKCHPFSGIFVGDGKPDWSPFLRGIITNLSSGVMINGIFLSFQVVALTADMPAKASVMNIQSFNAK